MNRLLIFTILILSAATLMPAAELSESRREDLYFLFEEEKMARDVYTVLEEIWNLRIFANIAEAETQHMNRILELGSDYGMIFTESPAGEFSDPLLQQMYDDLILQGSSSARDALEVGRLVEITDIKDIDIMLADNPAEDSRLVLENLRRGSENHLSAFNRQLDR